MELTTKVSVGNFKQNAQLPIPTWTFLLLHIGTYGIQASGNSLELKFVTHGPYSTNVGSRTYLMDSDSTYMMFKLKNKEFTFDVDVSNLPCGLNGALYFVEMDQDGGLSKYPSNKVMTHCGGPLFVFFVFVCCWTVLLGACCARS